MARESHGTGVNGVGARVSCRSYKLDSIGGGKELLLCSSQPLFRDAIPPTSCGTVPEMLYKFASIRLPVLPRALYGRRYRIVFGVTKYRRLKISGGFPSLWYRSLSVSTRDAQGHAMARKQATKSHAGNTDES